LGEGLTVGLHLGYTKQHNADFDGDESALHAPQSEDARREVAGIMGVACNIMDAQTNRNIAGVVFDALTGSYILSLPDTMVDPHDFMNITLFQEDSSGLPTLAQRLEEFHVPRYSGRALLSAIFPEDFYYQKDDTIIRKGILISGTLNKDNIGSAGGSIIQSIYKDYGQARTVDFLTDIYRTAGAYLDVHGFSVGMDDCFLEGEDPQSVINYEVEKAKMQAKSLGGKLIDPIEEERRENRVKAYLDTAKNFGARISKEKLGPLNSFNVMAKSGAKGSTFNIAQITGILGQQFIHGQRMPETMTGRTRTLPYFKENDLEPKARGFIANSYLRGLSPAEFFFAQAAGRIGLLDTATGVSEVGFGHRKLVKAMEDLKVDRDGSVRNPADIVFQFSYGDDSLNPEMLETVKTKSGTFPSFINIKRAAGRINQKYGF
jgi:DNA-directed RNA polymerase II subunit RPB1